MIHEGQMRGTVVLVHPDLDSDLLHQQNQVGVVCEANFEYDHIYVDFKYETGIYSADDLLIFLSQDDILENLKQLPAETSPETLRAIWKIEAFLGYHDVNWTFTAMQIARDHPEIQPLCITLLKDQIARNIYQQYGRG
jgi:hypothetical protein